MVHTVTGKEILNLYDVDNLIIEREKEVAGSYEEIAKIKDSKISFVNLEGEESLIGINTYLEKMGGIKI